MRIDAHVHFWQLDAGHDFPMRAKIAALQQDFMPADLAPLCTASGIDRVVLIQAAPTARETRYLLELSRDDALVAGVIGWLDLEAEPGQLDRSLDALAAWPKFKGIRSQPPRIFDARWLEDARVVRAYRRLAERSVPVDLLVNCEQLDASLALLRATPGINAVINHAGRPYVMTGQLEPWAARIRALAGATSAICKVSGLIERAGVEWTTETLRPWVLTLFDAFGCDRLIGASNWPLLGLMGSYAGWWQALAEIVDEAGLGLAEREALYGGTAARVYGLEQ